MLDAFAHARRVNGVATAAPGGASECLDPPASRGSASSASSPACNPGTARRDRAQWRANVGPQRWRHAAPMRGLHESGAVLAFSSDWNVAEMDPMVGLYTAATRADLDGAESWVP